MSSVLEHSSLTVWSSRDGTDILWVLNGGDDSSGENDLLPGLSNVDNVDSVLSSFEDVWSHLGVGVLGTDVGLSGQEHLDGLLVGIERGRQFRSRHIDGGER